MSWKNLRLTPDNTAAAAICALSTRGGVNGAFQSPNLTSTIPSRVFGGRMRRRATIRTILLALLHLAFANGSSALAQAGSTGGTIGKQDKSISGGPEEDRPRAAPRSKRSGLTPSNARGSSSQSDLTKPGALPGEPPYGALSAGQRILVRSAACPKGQVMEVTGGLKSLNIPRRRRCITTNWQ